MRMFQWVDDVTLEKKYIVDAHWLILTRGGGASGAYIREQQIGPNISFQSETI